MYYVRTSMAKPQETFAIKSENLDKYDVAFLEENGYHVREKPNSKGQVNLCQTIEELINKDRVLFNEFR